MESEKLGTMVIGGKIYNLDLMSSEELERLGEKLADEEEKLRKEIDKMIGLDSEEE